VLGRRGVVWEMILTKGFKLNVDVKGIRLEGFQTIAPVATYAVRAALAESALYSPTRAVV
jgi:hypothetical protein